MLPHSSNLATMQEQRVIYLLNDLFNPFEGMPLIGTQTLNPSSLTVGTKWNANSSTISIALNEL